MSVKDFVDLVNGSGKITLAVGRTIHGLKSQTEQKRKYWKYLQSSLLAS